MTLKLCARQARFYLHKYFNPTLYIIKIDSSNIGYRKRIIFRDIFPISIPINIADWLQLQYDVINGGRAELKGAFVLIFCLSPLHITLKKENITC